MSKSYLKVDVDRTQEFNETIKKFKRDAILVGIPAPRTDRKNDDEITNAALLAINVFGSPVNNIPARDVMTIGLRNARKEIADALRDGAVMALSRGFAAIDTYYNRAGIIASTSIKKAINSQEGIKPPSEATIAAREARGFKGEKALIVTGQVRNAITYVIKGKE